MHFDELDNTKELAYRNLTIVDIKSIYIDSLLTIGNFIKTHYKDSQLAYKYYIKAQAINPSYEKSYVVLGSYYLFDKKDCIKAESNLKKAIEISPFTTLSYFLLYSTYKECYNDNHKATEIAKTYTRMFHMDFYKSLSEVLSNVNKK